MSGQYLPFIHHRRRAARAAPRRGGPTRRAEADQLSTLRLLLDSERRLVEVIARDHFPLPEESPVYVRARAPVRISFGGGGSDLTHYFTEHGGAVINTTISLYSHATLRMREDAQVRILLS